MIHTVDNSHFSVLVANVLAIAIVTATNLRVRQTHPDRVPQRQIQTGILRSLSNLCLSATCSLVTACILATLDRDNFVTSSLLASALTGLDEACIM